MPVQITHGVNQQRFPAEGKTVAFISSQLKHAFNLPPSPQQLVNGRAVDPNHVLADGDQLEFVRERGRKGLGDVCTKEMFCKSLHVSREEWEQCKSTGLQTVRLGATEVLFIDAGTACLHSIRAGRYSHTLTLKLNHTEQLILETLTEMGPLTAEEIAPEVKRGFTSNFRSLLAGMVRHGVIHNDGRGYSVLRHQV